MLTTSSIFPLFIFLSLTLAETCSDSPVKRNLCYRDGALRAYVNKKEDCFHPTQVVLSSERFEYFETQVWSSEQQEWLLEETCYRNETLYGPTCQTERRPKRAYDETCAEACYRNRCFVSCAEHLRNQEGFEMCPNQPLMRKLNLTPPAWFCRRPRFRWHRVKRTDFRCVVARAGIEPPVCASFGLEA